MSQIHEEEVVTEGSFVNDRDKWIRAFNRLEKAVTNHISKDCVDSEGLAHAHAAVMRDLQGKRS